MIPLTTAEKKLVESSTYYRLFQKTNGWKATAKLLRDRIHKNSKGDRRRDF